jgi:hypothetical protein
MEKTEIKSVTKAILEFIIHLLAEALPITDLFFSNISIRD